MPRGREYFQARFEGPIGTDTWYLIACFLTTVAEELRRKDVFYKLGGADYLAGLVDYIPGSKSQIFASPERNNEE